MLVDTDLAQAHADFHVMLAQLVLQIAAATIVQAPSAHILIQYKSCALAAASSSLVHADMTCSFHQVPCMLTYLSSDELMQYALNKTFARHAQHVEKHNRADDMSCNCGLGTLPSQWSKLSSMTNLNLSSNLLAGQLPAAWASNGTWPELQTLNVSNNALTGMI